MSMLARALFDPWYWDSNGWLIRYVFRIGWWMVMECWSMSLQTFLSFSLIFTLTARILSHDLINMRL